jgi:hypothetical protein
VDSRVKGDCNCGTAWCRANGEVHLWNTVFKTGVSAVSISRQKK